jgi:chromosome segregation protein
MKLKRLTLHGFKSFADKTEFDFRDGITVIVGPNGCGKSNVVDAIKWVLGEQRPSSLRGKEMLDVIFSGTDQRKSQGFAEVALTFDNQDGLLAVDFDEVVVTRRLYRSGESEYLLNANRVRLRDIRELLMDSGGGPGALTVMEQGNIDRLLRADPHERRMVFEEAAGISKYRARRKETQSKLNRTHDNLDRLRDILGEYETRQRSLKIQAGKARRYAEFTEELKRKRLVGALARYRELFERQAEAQTVLDLVGASESAAREALEEVMQATSGQRTSLDSLREEITARESESATLFAESRGAQERKSGLERESQQLEARAATAEREGDEAARRALSLRAELTSAGSELDSAAIEEAQRDQQLEAADVLFREAEESVHLLRGQRDSLDMKRTDAFAAETSARNDEISAEAEGRALSGRIVRLDERAQTTGAELLQLEEAHVDTRRHVDEAEERVAALETKHGEAEQGAREARTELDLASEQEQELAGRVAALTARREMLEGLVERGEGLDSGIKALLAADRDGVLGTVADLIEDSGGVAEALDLALGGLAGAVVVETTEQAISALAWLRDGKRGRACLLPLDRVPETKIPERFSSVRSRIDGALGTLLSGCDVVETLEQAGELPLGRRIVVLTGEEFSAEGSVTGGTGQTASGLVRQRAHLAEVREQYAETTASRETASKRVAESRGSLNRWQEVLDDLRPRLRAATQERRTAGESFAAAEKAASSRADEIDLERAERAEVEGSVTECESRASTARVAREAAEAVRRQFENESRSLSEQIESAQAAREETSARRMDAKVDAARWTEKAGGLRQRVSDLEAGIAAAAREAETRAVEVKQAIDRRVACREEVATITEQSASRDTVLQGMQTEIDDRRVLARTLQDEVAAADTRLRDLRDAHEKHRAAMERHRLEENELRLRLESLVERVRTDYELDLITIAEEPQEEEDEQSEAPDAEALEAEIVELQDKLERLGNVNHAALEELEAVEEKLGFMRREENDLVEAEKQLLSTIERIDEECTTRFTKTFAEVTEHFKLVFRKLFGGGKAEIFLEDPEDVLGSGIEVRVRPPGKELRNMALLSGGERSLTAVALLFSIYMTKPPPFCLLDEVDAALDESNTVRMCEMIREFSLDPSIKGQFVVITHARPTMTIADTLYGVTMPEPGVSRRVAVRFEDIEAGAVVGLN